MKRKIRGIYIDGIENSGKTSVVREFRRFLKEKEKDLTEISGVKSYQKRLEMQEKALEDSDKSFVLKQGSLMQVFYDSVKENGSSPETLGKNFAEFIRKERDINHRFGTVHFFLVPVIEDSVGRHTEEFLEKNRYLIDFFNGINQWSISQGLDIKLIPYDNFDKIYDVRDKILDLLDKDYEI
jgi:hypothetical protein